MRQRSATTGKPWSGHVPPNEDVLLRPMEVNTSSGRLSNKQRQQQHQPQPIYINVLLLALVAGGCVLAFPTSPSHGPAAVTIVNKKTTVSDEKTGPAFYGKRNDIVRPERALTPSQQEELTTKWGQWSNDAKATRPQQDDTLLYQGYPNRDVPRESMPANAWQKDPARVQPFLKEGLALVDRAMEAILTEYGSGPTDKPHEDLESRQNTTFGLDMVMDLSSFQVGGSSGSGGEKPRLPRNGGWATPQSFRGLVRRVLHAIMTQDTFTLVLTGDAAAAGHGYVLKVLSAKCVCWPCV